MNVYLESFEAVARCEHALLLYLSKTSFNTANDAKSTMSELAV